MEPKSRLPVRSTQTERRLRPQSSPAVVADGVARAFDLLARLDGVPVDLAVERLVAASRLLLADDRLAARDCARRAVDLDPTRMEAHEVLAQALHAAQSSGDVDGDVRMASPSDGASDDAGGGSDAGAPSGDGGGGGGGGKRPPPDPAQIAALDEQIAKFEGQKRWADVVKALVQKAGLVSEPMEQMDTWERVARIHTEKTNNAAEAIKAYEAVLQVDPSHPAAIEFLKSRYEQRRDWEKLLGLLRREAEATSGSAQLDAYLAMARLAAEKVKKPEICIELWEKVLESDPSHVEALGQLSGFYERAKDFPKLANVLREQAAQTADSAARIALLVKLGTIAGDKLDDATMAVEAWKGVLALDPNDRRAQEALKKRFLAMQAWDELEVFYADSGKWDELIRVLEREAENPQATNETKIRLFFKIAQLWAERKEKTDRAAKFYEKVLELDAGNRAAALALIPIYAGGNDAKKLAGAYEIRLVGDETPEERVQTLRALGELYEGKLKEPAKAFERFRDGLLAAPEESRSSEDLERAARATSQWAEAVDALGKALEGDLAAESQVALRILAGRILAAELDRVDDAIARYRQVLDVDAGNQDALGSLEKLFRKVGRSRELLEILERNLELASDPSTRKDQLYAIGSLCESDLADPQRAVDTYNTILTEFGDEGPAMQRLDALYNKLEKWDELAQILERELVVFADNEVVSLDAKYRLGRVLELHLGRAREALDHYREILSLNPEHAEARGALEALLQNAELRSDAARVLEPIYEMRGDWEALIRALEVLLLDETNLDERISLLRKVGDVCGQQVQDGARAFEAYGRAFREAPTREDLAQQFEALAEPIAAWARYVELLRGVAETASEPELVRATWLKVAETEDVRLGHVEAAVAAYGKVLELDPADDVALGALEALYQRTERWTDLLGVYRKRLELVADPAAREQLLVGIAAVYDQKLGDTESSIRTYREILDSDPVAPRALEALDELFARLQRWNDLADNLQVRLEAASEPDQQLSLMNRLANLREEKMSEVEVAVDIRRQVLERDRSNEPALAALERLVQSAPHALLVAQVLEPVYREAGAFDRLVGIHEIQVANSAEVSRRVELLHSIAELHETALDNPTEAFRTLARALTEDPSHDETIGALERLARTIGNHADLAAVYESRIEAATTPELKVALHQRAASVHEDALQNNARAIEHYQKILEIDARNIDAVSSLERLYQLSEQWEPLALTYLRKAELLENPDEAKAYLFRASEIYETVLARPADAVGVFRRVLDVDAEDLPAIDALIRLFVTQSRWEELLAIYAKKVDLVSDAAEKKKLHMEVAAVYESELNDRAKAIDAYNRVLELDPDDLVAIQRLDHLYLSQENWTELLSILEREADLAADPNEICGYRYRIAELHEKHLNDVARAVEIYREILDVVPEHAPSIAALDAILHGEKEPLLAAAVLEPAYTAAGAYAQLADVLEVQLRHSTDVLQKVQFLHRIAEIHETALDSPRASFDAFARALPLDPLNEQTLTSMEKLAEVAQAWPDLVAVYDIEIENLAASPVDQVELALRTARIYEVQVGNVATAIARYRKALDVDAVNSEAVRSLSRLHEALEQWPELADVLRREAELPDVSPDDAVQLRFRLAQVFEGALGNVDGAIQAYREILDSQSDHAPSIQALEHVFARGIRQSEIAAVLRPIYESQGEWTRLAGVLETVLEFVKEPADRLAAMYELAEMVEGRLSDAVGALGWYARALKEVPTDERAGLEAERLAGSTAAWADLAGTYADIVEATGDATIKQAVGKRLARVYEEELNDLENAEASYNYVLSVVPLDPEALERLDVIYSAAANTERLAEVLDRRVRATEDVLQKVELSMRLAQLLEGDLQRPAEAIARYRSVADQFDSKNEQALEALERLYLAGSNWPELFGTYGKKLEVAYSDADRADILARMAGLAAGQLGKADEAVRLWNEVLTLRGEDTEALTALGELHEAAGRFADVIDVLERGMSSTDDFEAKARVALRIARTYENSLRDRDRAIESYRRVLDIDAGNIEALDALANIFRKGSNWEDLVATLQTEIQVGAATLDAARMRELWAELGRIFQGTLQQMFEATDAWRHVIEIDPVDSEAIEALLVIHTQQEEWRDVVDVLNTKANATSIEEARIPLYLEAARVWEQKLEQPDGAREVYEKILAIDTLHDHAFKTIETLHTAAERWEPVIEVYINRHDALEESEISERVDMMRRAAAVYDEKLADSEQAYAAAVLAFEENVADDETIRLLERVTARGAKWNDLMQTLTEWWKTAQGERWTHIGLSMAKWYGVELNHPDWAIPIYQQVLTREPDNLLALHSMTALYRKLQQWPQLAQLLERCIAVARGEDDRRRLHVELGEVLEAHLGNPDSALEHYKTALASNAKDVPALTCLERVYEIRQNWPELVDVLKRKVDALTDPGEIVAARLKGGEIVEDRIGDTEAAVPWYRGAVDIEAGNLPALRGLERLYAKLNKPADLLRVLETELEHVPSERERVKLLIRIAEMLEEEFSRIPESIQRFEQVVELDPNSDHALRGLERLYRRQSQWKELVNTYERHISATRDRAERVPLFYSMGGTFADELNDFDHAVDAFQNALELDPHHQPTLEHLAKVYERQQDWHRAVETLETLSGLIAEPERIVAIRFQLGKLSEEKLEDESRAIDFYKSALDVDAVHMPSLTALRLVATRREDWHDATKFLEREIAATDQARTRSRLEYELGRIWNEHLHEQDRAVTYFEQAMRSDEDNEDAAFPLVHYYVSQSRWADAEPLAEMLVRKGSRQEPAEQLQLNYVMGQVAARLGKHDRAIRALTTAHGIDRSNIEVLRELALAYYDKQDWENAFKHYHLLLVHHKDELDADGRADLYFRLGVIKREQGDRRRAINFLEKSLEEVPNYRAALEAMVETHTQNNEWEQVIGFKRQILDAHVTETEETYGMLLSIGALWQEKVKNSAKAIEAFASALDLKPSEHSLMHKLLALYQETKQWTSVIDMVEKISSIEKDMAKKSRYSYTIASIYNSELKNPEEAVVWYNKALDENPKELRPFAKINEILTAQKEFKQLERSFRKMIHRVTGKGEVDLEFNLWHNLGVIYRDRLEQSEAAVTAFKMASDLKPGDATEHKILAELYTSYNRPAEAVHHWMQILEQEVNNPDALAALYDLHYGSRAYDKAWCVAAAMVFLLRDRARDDAKAFYEQYKPKRPLAPQARLDEERWIKDLFHPTEDPYIGKMFASILPALRRVKVQPVARFGLTDKERQDPATSSVSLVRAMGLAGAALNLPLMPLVFLRPEQPGGLTYVPSEPWASLAGSGLLRGLSPQELQFVTAKHMAFYRFEHYVRVLFPTVTELTPLMLAAIKIVKTDFEVPGEIATTVQTLQQQMAQDPVNYEGLRKVVRLFLEQGGQVNIKKWFQSVELTACRTGFLLSGDLDVAKKMLSLEPGLPGDVAPNEKLKDVVLFSISEPYFRLREALGITFQAAAAY